jgi:hypothetical protein
MVRFVSEIKEGGEIRLKIEKEIFADFSGIEINIFPKESDPYPIGTKVRGPGGTLVYVGVRRRDEYLPSDPYQGYLGKIGSKLCLLLLLDGPIQRGGYGYVKEEVYNCYRNNLACIPERCYIYSNVPFPKLEEE